ncbi:MAG TPA: RHS repeat-associated core domain-containing protein [Verrucomicrobiae bacterium]|nr:RHS repeat-associated core domain-containing protein [Verrucomicrobiae bacterium]
MKTGSAIWPLVRSRFLKSELIPGFAKQLKRLAMGGCALIIVSTGYSDPAPMKRTVAKIEPPKTSLEFSANPTADEIFRAHIFQEPLVPVGGKPTEAENSALGAALLGYAKRSGPDDFSALTGFLEEYPQSPWRAALLTDLGLEYYNTAHYSRALDAWSNAWAQATNASDRNALAVVDRALGELVYMNARLGRMEEIARLLKAVEKQPLLGPAAERVVEAREALWNMQNHPEISFRCGPLALRSIRAALNINDRPGDLEIFKSASTQKGCSLRQVAELSAKVGLNYQMAFRNPGTDFAVPSVVHWKVGHYAALVRKVGNLYELQDPTFGNKTWATKEALEAETTGYFLVAGALPVGWRAVDENEGAAVWGKGMTGANDPQHIAKNDLATAGTCQAQGVGMAVASIHMMDVNLNLKDQPVGYKPPVGPPVPFTVRYNQRDMFQPGNFNYGNLGPQWTSDWFTYITDNPTNVLADVNLYVGGGGQRTYTGFDTNTQSFAYQQYDRNLLTRTGPNSYQLLDGDGSRMVFSQPDGSIGTSRNIYLTQSIDPQGNAVTLTYDTNFCLVAITDAIGQVTTLAYGLPSKILDEDDIVPADQYKLTSVTDPFGRVATFGYIPVVIGESITVIILEGAPISRITEYWGWQLATITDEIGLTSQFGYDGFETPVSGGGSTINYVATYEVNKLTTPYGTTTFLGHDDGNERSMEINYPDGSKERVEYNQTNSLQPMSDPLSTVPAGMSTYNANLRYRDSYYWDRTACALGYGDYSKARLYHFLHTENLASTSGALESVKMPLEGRVWYDYAGQSAPYEIGPSTLPAHVGRVLDDGTTQFETYGYNPFGHLISAVDPLGRTFSYVYDTNGIDLLEVRQTRAGDNELLVKAIYNSQHLPLSVTDAAGQTTTCSYNARGQILTMTDAKNETVAFTYDSNGYLLAADGPLPGTNDVVAATYDAYGRVRSLSDVSGYRMTYDYDNLNRLTRITFPDGTLAPFSYDRLDCVAVTDRAGRKTSFEYDNMRQLTKKTDPLGRATLLEWCSCGALKSLTDPMGRTTSWLTDVQGRRTAKQYLDGSQVQYSYESTTSRPREIIDEKHQATFYTYNLDDSILSISHGNTTAPTPNVSYTYDSNYDRVVSMTDGIGTTTYGYIPITAPPGLGAGALGSVAGPLTNNTIAYAYDELGRRVKTSIDGITTAKVYDATGRLTGVSNELGSFIYAYDGSSSRLVSENDPNGQTATISYGNNLQDFVLQQINYAVGTTPISQFSYGFDISHGQITTWSQQAGAQPPSVFSFGYDAANQLLSAAITNSGAPSGAYAYSYDPSGNRLTEQAGGTTATAIYNALNQISAAANAGINSRTNEWDGQNRLTAVNAGSQRTEFAYDGLSRLAYIRQLQNGSETSFRRFVWCGDQICEERDKSGSVINKRFFPEGVKLETGTNGGAYYYTRDHLGSIRELTDAGGNVRARYAYDPFGRRTKVSGDADADFGFAGMLWSSEASLALTHYRAYDPALGRWLSRDPLPRAEMTEGPNLYAYAANEPVMKVDAEGLAGTLPGWGFNTVTVTLTTMAVMHPEELTEFVEDLGLGAQTVAAHGAEIAQDCAYAESEIMDTVVPAVESHAGIEIAEGVVVQGQELEEWLVQEGQLGGDRFKPDSLDLMEQFTAQEQSYFNELSPLLRVYNYNEDIVDFATAARWAHRMAVDYFGFDTDFWLR